MNRLALLALLPAMLQAPAASQRTVTVVAYDPAGIQVPAPMPHVRHMAA